MLLLLLASISSFSCLFFFFIVLTSNLTSPSPNVTNKVIIKVVNPTCIPTTDANEAIVSIPLVTKRKTKLISRNSRTSSFAIIQLILNCLKLLFPNPLLSGCLLAEIYKTSTIIHF